MSDKPLPKLVVNTNSWHYRYYRWLCQRYNSKYTPGDQTSLCVYFQSMLWGSILAVVLVPFLLVGAIGTKIVRVFLEADNRIADWFNRGPIGQSIDKVDEAIMETPIGSTAIIGFAYSVVAAALLLVVAILAGLVAHISALLSGLASAALNVGWAFFWVCSFFGWLTIQAKVGIVWLFTAEWLWFAILKWTGISIAGLAALGVICFVLLSIFRKVSEMKFYNRFSKWVLDQYNGFEERRKERKKRREASRPQGEWNCEFCDGLNWVLRRRCIHCDARNPATVTACTRSWDYLTSWFKTRIKIKDHVVDVLGPLGILKGYFWAIKHRACPTLEFVSTEELQERAIAAVQIEQRKREMAEEK